MDDAAFGTGRGAPQGDAALLLIMSPAPDGGVIVRVRETMDLLGAQELERRLRTAEVPGLVARWLAEGTEALTRRGGPPDA